MIKRKISIEDLISRVPGLFPYIEEDAYGIVKLHNSIDSENGCYGKIIPDLKVDFKMDNPDDKNDKGESIIVFEKGKFYSYRALMNNYYRLKSVNRKLNEGETALIEFIDGGIGKVQVPSTIKGKLVPTFMFLVEIKEWWKWFQNMKPLCDCSKTPSSISDNDCCTCIEYCDRGGNDMYSFLQKNVEKISTISDTYYNAANINNFGNISMNLLFTNDIDDMGIGTIYSEEWVAGKKYHVGEIVLYNEESWILYQGLGGVDFTICDLTDTNRFDDRFYYYGNYKEDTDVIEFDSFVIENGIWVNEHWKRNVTNDISYLTPECKNVLYKNNIDTNVYSLPINSYYIKENDSYYSEKWVADKKYHVGEIVLYNDESWMLYQGLDDGFYWYGDAIKFNNDKEVCWKRNVSVDTTGITDSKLISLRKVKRLIDEEGKETAPNNNSNVDWLCLYEKDVVLNIQTWVDDNGNIVWFDDWDEMALNNIKSTYEGDIPDKNYSKSLIAFGDMLKDITTGANNTIIFTYLIGSHLIGDGINSLTSTTETTKYRFNNFINDSAHTGIEYTETYYYNPEVFKYDFGLSSSENLKIGNKGIFYTTGSKSLIKSNLGNDGKVLNNILTDFKTKRTEPSYIFSKEFRTDDLIGVTFDPIVDTKVVVNRGVNASFERHLKLGEVKTLNDLVNYGNNFFNVKNINK